MCSAMSTACGKGPTLPTYSPEMMHQTLTGQSRQKRSKSVGDLPNWFAEVSSTFLGRPQGMTLCLHDRVSVCVSVCLSVRQHFGIHFFIGLYLFNTATDQVHFCHACTLGPGLYSPNVFGDAALINYANLCKICKSVDILVYTFLHFGIHFFYRFTSF